MTTQERSVEEIVEEFEKTWSAFIGDIEFNDAFEHLADDPDAPFFVLPEMCNWLTQTLQAERQKREEAVEVERERIAKELRESSESLGRNPRSLKDILTNTPEK